MDNDGNALGSWGFALIEEGNNEVREWAGLLKDHLL
jgi:hypothetical protein